MACTENVHYRHDYQHLGILKPSADMYNAYRPQFPPCYTCAHPFVIER